MKTKTYKSLIAIVILLQLVAIGSLIFGAQAGQATGTGEREKMLRLTTDLMHAGISINDYQLAFATGDSASGNDMRQYQELKETVLRDLDSLERSSEKNRDRLAVYQEQRKLLMGGDRIVQAMREAMVARMDENRFGIMVVLLAGMRKLNSISHKVIDNFDILLAPETSLGLPVYQLIAAFACGLSLLLGGVLIAKAPTSY